MHRLMFLLILPTLTVLPADAHADRVLNRQLYTLCTLGLPGSFRAADCRRLWLKCEAYDEVWSDRNCKVQFFPSARGQADRRVRQVIREHSADKP